MQPAREISYVFRYAPDDCSARLEVVVQKTEEMRANGFESDRATINNANTFSLPESSI
jgi:hypothetical protein